jgi:trehalose-phosphatase
MRSFWTVRASFAKALRAKSKVVLLFDFDGTLAPIVGRPERARLSGRARRVLHYLACHPRVTVGLVTGRSLADIQRRAGLEGALHVASHGLEYALPEGRCVSLLGRPWPAILRQLRRRVRQCLPEVTGLRCEPKPHGLAIHYRQVRPSHVPRLLRAARRVGKEFHPVIRLQQGKKVVEFLPNVGVTKATAVRAILAPLARGGRGACLVVYFGDDLTDEPVFRALGRRGWTVRVGGARARTAARFYLRSPAAVGRWLEWLREVTV